ncbi:MAG: bifunctional pyr operon transcriptional regulator/uracil phosphoribosyltransferase PyrR [Eubacteriales bacterium]|nr:bifunctional pyr operon transcriptional regulator/uracil phosphoribosyltransferase PyrR [Eubacteriales bacterium]
MQYKAQIMDEAALARALTRMSHQILEKNHGAQDLCLIGIRTRGVPLACRIAENIRAIDGGQIPVGELDITLYRDDLDRISPDPHLNATDVPFSVEGKTVVLVDDVIYTGRTARAALDAVMALGRPARVQLCVLIDRGHLELPIKATYVGKNIPTGRDEVVSVRLEEADGQTGVAIYQR